MNIFEVQPSIFEIQEGESFVIEILFKPPDQTQFIQDIVIACDNCTTAEFKIIGQGQLAKVELLESDSNSNHNQVNNIDFKDYWAKQIIKFDDLNPHMVTRKKLSILNKSYALFFLNSCGLNFMRCDQ